MVQMKEVVCWGELWWDTLTCHLSSYCAPSAHECARDSQLWRTLWRQVRSKFSKTSKKIWETFRYWSTGFLYSFKDIMPSLLTVTYHDWMSSQTKWRIQFSGGFVRQIQFSYSLKEPTYKIHSFVNKMFSGNAEYAFDSLLNYYS